ncbi:TIGR04190 family B12-binding domain/radical SAM domain protein, partial [Candidatus Bathyarchaeota archaeon]|nr:TIGR04190 family B12-binding domain/radical SAM domain protein [Candidatus Bathyarchaeota archaeon]
PIFEMYPLGFLSMVGYLEENGYHARIINLAVKMLKNPNLKVEELISKLNAKVFGLDLHWLAHANGSLEVASLIKKYHEDVPVILGGISSTYYHEEIISLFPQVDYVIRGDSTEKPLLKLLEYIDSGKEPENVENLTWRDSDGRKHINPLIYVPEDLDELSLDYGVVVKLVLKHRDLESNLPYESFMDYPFTAILTCKGCTNNCTTCGGSKYSFNKFYGREKPAFKSPKKIAEEMKTISEYFKAPIFLLGDLRQGGADYADSVLKSIKNEGIDNTITLELFEPADKDYLDSIAENCERFTMEISPDSHDEKIRRLQGRYYDTASLEKSINYAMEKGCEKFDVFFMIGLPGQSKESAVDSVNYSRRLLEKMSGKIYPFIAPMAPFLDPGSMAFENPGMHGYYRRLLTLREHREALLQPSWKLILNYETNLMTRDKIVDATYEAMIKMNEMKKKLGIISIDEAERISKGLELAWDVTKEVDHIASLRDEEEKEKRLLELREKVKTAYKRTNLAKKDLRTPGRAGIRISGVLKHLIRGRG